MIYDTYIFDLDGTLLDTIGDLTATANYALRLYGMPERTKNEIRSFMGNGVRRMLMQAVPDGADNPRFEDVLDAFNQYYKEHSLDTTRPFDGIPETLAALKARGCRLAVVSNKSKDATQALCRHFFSDTIEVSVGENDAEGIRKKPAPDLVNAALRQLGVGKENAVCVGDTEVDIMTAHNAGLPSISVLWGFRDLDFLKQHGAKNYVSAPQDLLL